MQGDKSSHVNMFAGTVDKASPLQNEYRHILAVGSSSILKDLAKIYQDLFKISAHTGPFYHLKPACFLITSFLIHLHNP